MTGPVPTVCVLGLGYIGLPTAATIAQAGLTVVGVDTNAGVVAAVNSAQIHIDEPGLQEVVATQVMANRLRATSAPVPSDVFLVCVPTPFIAQPGTPIPDTTMVLAATRAIAAVVQPGNLVIIESTCPVGTTEAVREELAELGVDVASVAIAYCPERVLPGQILRELEANDRIIGGLDERAADAAQSFYQRFVKGSLLRTDSRTAEMVKLVENSYRDVNIAFANEVSILADHLGLDAWEVIRLANRHPRVAILQPGAGVGGHCIAVDPWFIVAADPGAARLIRTARSVNDDKTTWVIDTIRREYDRISRTLGRPAVVACLGLAYKANVGDLRESPALRVATSLAGEGIAVLACEPNISSHPDLRLATVDEAVNASDLIALLVGHREFEDLSAGTIPVLDFCGLTRMPRDRVDN